MQEIQRLTPRNGTSDKPRNIANVIGINEEVVNSARKVLQQTGKRAGKDLVAELTIDELRKKSPTTVNWETG